VKPQASNLSNPGAFDIAPNHALHLTASSVRSFLAPLPAAGERQRLAPGQPLKKYNHSSHKNCYPEDG
jgi:hypothetical protein